MISCQRDLFNIPENISYFNSAYLSPQLNESKKALIEGANLKSVPWEWTSEKFFADVEKIRAAQPDIQVFSYDADHGFNCDHRASFNQKAADQALERSLEFFAQHLAR